MHHEVTIACTLFEPDEHVKAISRVYDETWVERLYRAVQRNTTVAHKFVCWTDRYRSFDHPIAQEIIESGYNGMQKNLLPLMRSGRVFKLDLDNVIVGNIDDLVMFDAELAMPSDPLQPQHVISSPILTTKPLDITGYRQHKSEQAFLRTKPCTRFPEGEIVSYKKHVQGRGLPKSAKIVHFHGKPKMHEVYEDFVWEHWL